MFKKRTGNGASTENVPANYANTLSIVSKKELTTFPKYLSNVKYNYTSTSRSISSKDQHKWLIPRRSARLKKHQTCEHQSNCNNKQISFTNKYLNTYSTCN